MIDFESLFSSSAGESMSFGNTLMIIAAALILGFIISLVYIATHKKEGYAPSFPITLIMLPAIISIIILLVGNSIAKAFSLAGAFSLIRFRSAPGDPKDIAYVFFALGVGLACGIGYIIYAAIFALILCSVMFILYKTKYAAPPNTAVLLKITIPENLNFQGAFDDILRKYTDSWHLNRIKTSDFGTLYNVVYRVDMKKGCDQKSLIDELRCRNGNLDIALTLCEYEDKVYL